MLILNCAEAFTDALTPFYPDTVMTPYTKYVYDGLDTDSWPSQGAMAVGAAWKDLMPGGGGDAVLSGAAVPFSGGGFQFDATAGQLISLPAAAKIPATSVGFLAVIWIHPLAGITSSCRIAGWHRDYTGPWGVTYDQASGKHVIVADGGTNGSGVTLTAAVHQLGMARVSDDGGLTFKRKIYVDGVEAFTAASGATAGQPSVLPPFATIGDGGSSNFAGNYLGGVYRHTLEDVGVTTGVMTSAYALSQVQKDYADNAGRGWV